MSVNNRILVPLHGEQVGLDINHNLLVEGDSLVLSHKKVARQILRAAAGALTLNGVPVGGAGAFDPSGTTLVSTTLQAALVELSNKIDAVLS